MYDFHVKAVPVDVVLVWAGQADYTGETREGDLHREAFDGCVAQRDGAPYQDVHCHTFTPESFVDVFEKLSEFGLVEFAIVDFVPTQVNTVEFIVRLERLDPKLSDTQRLDRQYQSFSDARQAIATGPVPSEPDLEPEQELPAELEPEPAHFALSEREERWIRAKRWLLTSARTLFHPGRTRNGAPGPSVSPP
jgi:hypothetical protein